MARHECENWMAATTRFNRYDVHEIAVSASKAQEVEDNK